ncbi:phage terminase small subunit P27 family [Micromonospora aurantiaca (nom. illeg.)]|uniref:phage terminase small subunit P27 family n=1 Tax=Micromonospora aurantiaca (nom. illeg.) TaxID=47850 RepID=UPI0016572CAE|nr:phage terminase small subunit P27 family [Micromonospora aurantiaca]MBC9001276.1 phage terminase small subunit P27 family [Micromonospora aurantiaca]
MGSRGPKPAPTALKLVRGTRADRVNTDEPVPSPAAREIEPPAWLGDEAVEIWEEYAPDLIRKGVLTAWDVEAFAVTCDAAARRRKAAAALAAEGEVVQLPVFDKNGKQTGHRVTRNPWTVVLGQADRQLQSWAARFGLTPSDRAQLTGGDGRRDPHEDLLTG